MNRERFAIVLLVHLDNVVWFDLPFEQERVRVFLSFRPQLRTTFPLYFVANVGFQVSKRRVGRRELLIFVDPATAGTDFAADPAATAQGIGANAWNEVYPGWAARG